MGFFYPYHARYYDGVPGGRLVPEFPQYFRVTAFDIRICHRACPFQYRDEPACLGGHVLDRRSVLQVVFRRLWPDDIAFSDGAFFIRDLDRHTRQRARAPFRSGLGMVHLAASRAHFSFCGGVLYPVATLPVWMQGVSRFLPPSYVFEGLRAIVHGGNPPQMALVWGGLLAVVYILLAYWFFIRVYQKALRTGLIARYSAENLG